MPKINSCLATLALAVTLSFATNARAEKRVALLIGNNAYQSVGRLQTAINDARGVGAALRGLGFSVIIAENQSRRAMSEALLAFDKAIEPGDIALFFFAGHGFEIRGQNYLLPTDIPEVREGQEELIRDAAFPASRIIDRLQERGARTTVLVLDACRNNPFDRAGGRGLRGSGGLAAMTPAEGVFIMFSAGSKQIAMDRLSTTDRATNSVFTRNLIRQLAEPDLTLVQIAKRLQIDVRQLAASVGGEQTPAYYDQVVGEIVLNPSGRVKPATPPPAATAALLSDVDKRAAEAVPAPSADPVFAELDALAAARSWSELRGQLTNVKPTARDAHWAALAEQAAIGELTPLANSARPFSDRLAALEHYATAFQVLTDNPKFLALRASIGLSAFGDCLDQGYGTTFADCRRELEAFVRTTPDSVGTARADLARDAARLVGRKLNRPAAAPFFAIAIEPPAGANEAVCADPDLATAVIAAFGRPPDWNEAKAAGALTEACWKTLGPAVVAQVARETGDSYYLGNTCPILLKRDALTGLREARCREIVSR
jgi:Caspase domain